MSSPGAADDDQHDEGVSPRAAQRLRGPWIGYWPAARNAPTDG
jgi:hypothetical protein